MTGNETETPEQQIARLKRELEFLQNKFQIVGSITRHDILNQMTAIMGYNELLLTMVQDEKVVGFLEIQRKASDKIRRIFAYSKVYGNIGAEPPRWQKLDALVHLACDAAKLGTVAVTTDPDLKSCSLLLDTQAVQVFAYLFDNSVLHGKRVTTIRISLLQQGDGPVLVVGDDGEGIPAAEKEKIFAKGFGKRTGWGLFVAREILAATGMAIRETGVPGTGARFEIAIPPDHIRLAGEKP